MGRNIDEGVVDGNLRVYGVRQLRVIDASIDPVIPDCRPQQVVYMTAEKVCSSTSFVLLGLADLIVLGIGHDQKGLSIPLP